jgi:glucose-1-phosphate cytidylyltransferase
MTVSLTTANPGASTNLGRSTGLPPVAILAGGLGTRLSEETAQRPKPMVEVGGMPILWHVMMQYYARGMNEFVIALGYKKEALVRYFLDLHEYGGDLTVRTRDGTVDFHNNVNTPDWIVHLIDTGPETMTGGRIKRLAPHLGRGTFMLTWCDGVSDVDLLKLLAFHRTHGKLATVTAVRSPARFGHIDIGRSGDVLGFQEKPRHGDGWINGAFFVLEPGVFDYIAGDATSWEHESMRALAADGQLVAYQHTGFWQCMDSLRDRQTLEGIWRAGEAPWKTWE